MEERIEKKIDEIIEGIIAKKSEEITYSEYKILDSRAKDLMYRKEQEKRNKEMAEMMAKTFAFTSVPAPLPDPMIKEEN